jgi:hypothetical protein
VEVNIDRVNTKENFEGIEIMDDSMIPISKSTWH